MLAVVGFQRADVVEELLGNSIVELMLLLLVVVWFDEGQTVLWALWRWNIMEGHWWFIA